MEDEIAIFAFTVIGNAAKPVGTREPLYLSKIFKSHPCICRHVKHMYFGHPNLNLVLFSLVSH